MRRFLPLHPGCFPTHTSSLPVQPGTAMPTARQLQRLPHGRASSKSRTEVQPSLLRSMALLLPPPRIASPKAYRASAFPGACGHDNSQRKKVLLVQPLMVACRRRRGNNGRLPPCCLLHATDSLSADIPCPRSFRAADHRSMIASRCRQTTSMCPVSEPWQQDHLLVGVALRGLQPSAPLLQTFNCSQIAA